MTIGVLAEAAEKSASEWVEIAGLIVQGLAVVVAVAASTTALIMSVGDRKTLITIAQRDREHERLRTELEYAVRLSANRNRGGSTDELERKQMGAEALALASVVGERWVPRQYERAMDYKTPAELAAMLAEPETPDNPRWVKDKIESGLAVQRIMHELYRED